MNPIEISSDSESSDHYFPTPLPPRKPRGRLHGWRTKEEARKRHHDVPAPPAPPSQPIRPSAPPLPFPSSDSDSAESDIPELLFYEDVKEEPYASTPLSELLAREAERAIANLGLILIPKRLEKPPPQVLGLVCKRLWTSDTKPKNVEKVLRNFKNDEITSDPKDKGKRKLDEV